MEGNAKALEDYHVRLPRDVKDKLPIARLRSGKKIQELICDGIREQFRKVNL